jgi:hypothetical protein
MKKIPFLGVAPSQGTSVTALEPEEAGAGALEASVARFEARPRTVEAGRQIVEPSKTLFETISLTLEPIPNTN